MNKRSTACEPDNPCLARSIGAAKIRYSISAAIMHAHACTCTVPASFSHLETEYVCNTRNIPHLVTLDSDETQNNRHTFVLVLYDHWKKALCCLQRDEIRTISALHILSPHLRPGQSVHISLSGFASEWRPACMDTVGCVSKQTKVCQALCRHISCEKDHGPYEVISKSPVRHVERSRVSVRVLPAQEHLPLVCAATKHHLSNRQTKRCLGRVKLIATREHSGSWTYLFTNHNRPDPNQSHPEVAWILILYKSKK